MNDAETEGRRLLAAATEDMPPEIDLLGGFPAARSRDRARRTRRRAVLSAGVAAVAASATAVTLAIGSAPPASATVTTALTRSLAQSYHLTETTTQYYIQNVQITNRSQLTCTTEADPVRHREAKSCTNGPFDREAGGYTYFYVPFPVDHPGRHWERLPGTPGTFLPAQGVDAAATAPPQQMLAQAKKVGKVTAVGSARGPGWTGTRYALSSDEGNGTTATGTLEVDRQGRARVLDLTTLMATENTVLVTTENLTFSDFGAPVTVTPPPADQTYDGP